MAKRRSLHKPLPPRTGQFREAGIYPNGGAIIELRPPSAGRGNDWVLVIDSIRR
ncbi:putative collagen-binding domain-containing protein [Cohnella yongneupensis]|uniref:Collagen-binding domain-containing protein n=1 Tax=Cohnella yongneupensis TaxID=425006 RepID=A0ABW0R3M1_9BACL